MGFNLLKNIVNNQKQYTKILSLDVVCINTIRCKNTKTARIKLPSEGKNQSKWVSRKRAEFVDDRLVDKKLEGREIVDPVWLFKEYKPKVYQIEEAISYHKELAQPEMLNNLSGFLQVRLILDMNTKKKTKFLDNVKGAVFYPHYFKDGFQKEVVAICKDDAQIEACKQAGALFAGYEDIIKKFEKGEISDQSYEYLVCTPETFPDVMSIKKKINKDKLPSVKTNTVVANIAEIVKRLHLSKDYDTAKISDSQALLKSKIGLLNFETQQLVENLEALLKKLLVHKKFDPENFITDCVLYAAPSTEKFKVDISRFIENEKDLNENEKPEQVLQ